MNIGIIVHSQTGTTMDFGRRIAERLRAAGHEAEVIEIKSEGNVRPRAAKITITNIPDCRRFDAVLVGGPVWGFAASPVIIACIKALPGIAGKKALPFVTMGFPLPGMGGRQAIAGMSRALGEAGAKVLPGFIIPKMFHNVNQLMDTAAAAIPASLA